jgi:hypothetical protein
VHYLLPLKSLKNECVLRHKRKTTFSPRDGEKINQFSFDFAFYAKTRNTWTGRAQKAKSSEKENRFISVKLLNLNNGY